MYLIRDIEDAVIETLHISIFNVFLLCRALIDYIYFLSGVDVNEIISKKKSEYRSKSATKKQVKPMLELEKIEESYYEEDDC